MITFINHLIYGFHIFQTIPYVKYLLFLLEKLPRSGLCQMRGRLISETKKYFRGADPRPQFPNVEEVPHFQVATILDPRFKKSGFSDPVLAERAVQVVSEELDLQAANELVEEVHNVSVASTDDPWDTCMAEEPTAPAHQRQASGGDELQEYLQTEKVSRKDSATAWWGKNKDKYPKLASLARKFLCPPMGSIASEREFKLAKRIVEDRWRVKPETVEKLLFIKYNLRYIG